MNAIRREALAVPLDESGSLIRPLWTEWQCLSATPYTSEPESDRVGDQMRQLQDAISAAEASSLDELECKLEMARTLTAEGLAPEDNLLLGILVDFRRLAVPGVPNGADPIIEMLKRRKALAEAASLLPSSFTPGGHCGNPPEVEAAWLLVEEVTSEIERTPATTLSGVIAKLTLRAEIDALHDGWPAGKSPYHEIIADIERLSCSTSRQRHVEPDPVVKIAKERHRLCAESKVAAEALMAIWKALPDDVRRSPTYTTKSLRRMRAEDTPSDIRIQRHACATEEQLEESLRQWRAQTVLTSISEDRIQAARAEWHADKARIEAAVEASGYNAAERACDKAIAREDEVDVLLAETPATSVAGLIAQMEYLLVFLEPNESPATIANRVLSSLRCLAETGALLPCRTVSSAFTEAAA